MALWRYMALKIVLLFYRLLNGFTSLVFSFSLFSGHSRERLEMSKVYEKSAHVLKVKWKMRKFELEGPELKKHFLLRYVFYPACKAILQLHWMQSSIECKPTLNASYSNSMKHRIISDPTFHTFPHSILSDPACQTFPHSNCLFIFKLSCVPVFLQSHTIWIPHFSIPHFLTASSPRSRS